MFASFARTSLSLLGSLCIPYMDFLNKRYIAALNRLREEVASLRESIDSFRNQKERQHQQEQAERKLPRLPFEVGAEIHKKRGREGKENSDHKREFWPEWITAISTSLAFIAAAIYAGEAGCQLRTTNKTYREIQTLGMYPQAMCSVK